MKQIDISSVYKCKTFYYENQMSKPILNIFIYKGPGFNNEYQLFVVRNINQSIFDARVLRIFSKFDTCNTKSIKMYFEDFL